MKPIKTKQTNKNLFNTILTANKQKRANYDKYIENRKVMAFCDALFLQTLESDDAKIFLDNFEKNMVSFHLSIILGINNFSPENDFKGLITEIFNYCKEEKSDLNDPFAVVHIVKYRLGIK